MDGNDKYVGRILDNRYEILELIGSGGMALVYKARCHRLNRMVAIKILKEDLAGDEEFQRRFYTESQAVAMLSHPNIVAVYDVSRAGNTEYIVMELIEGITLKQYINRKGLLNWKEALHFATQITKALSHAHSRGIIHRDIKPHNIMILKDGSVKVADFGIARLLAVSHTLTQEALGSVHYISPEQAKGGHIDARSDIYSVGVVMYEMLTSRLPFVGDSAVSVAIQHISAIPLMPRDINPDVPIGLEDITMHAMEPDLNMRFTTAEEMLGDLEEFRKNPSIVFSYALSDSGSRQDALDEPFSETRQIPVVPPANVKPVADMQRERVAQGVAKPAQAERKPAQQRPQNPAPAKAAPDVAAMQRAERLGMQPKRLRRQNRDMTQDEYRASKTRASSTSTLVGIFSVIVFLVVIVVFMWNFFLADIFGAQQREPLIMPSFLNRRFEDIIITDEYTNIFNFIPREEHSTEFAHGLIISQNPMADRQLSAPLPGARINVELIVSIGAPPPTLMPDLIGTHWGVARNELINRNINLYIDTVEVASDAPLGLVVETIPPAGEMLASGHTVIIRYSGGPDIMMVNVPDLELPTTYAALTSAFRGLDLVLMFDEFFSTVHPLDTVTYIRFAGEEVAAGTAIAVSISLGPEEIEEPEPPDDPYDPYDPEPPDGTYPPPVTQPPYVTPPEGTPPGTGEPPGVTYPPYPPAPPEDEPPLIDEDIIIDDDPPGE
ncbi:MAG: Stk1 family PASTA domain-containing Ser/Thr kinase [Oscillospiraceae bacterium]|nr:Stk1 family PASTA domain-containing Ser/Thr kinase [Oscillospiraceae bacterium]